MNEDGSPAIPTAPVTQPEAPVDYSTPNDLDYEMSQEQEQQFVDQILASGNYTAPVADKPVDAPIEPAADVPKTPEAPVEPVVPVAPVEPVTPPAPTLKTPSEVSTPQTDDLWIEVEKVVTDDLGEQTTQTVKLTYDPNDPGSFIPDDFTAKSTKQLADILEAKAEMAKIYGDRQSEFDKASQSQATLKQEQDILAGWDIEIQDLVDAGAIPDAKKEKDEHTAMTDAVFTFMTEQNKQRVAAGKAPIQSFGTAFALYEKDASIAAEKEAKKQEILDTKAKGAMVGGSSSASVSGSQKKAYTPGSYSNIYEVPIPDGE